MAVAFRASGLLRSVQRVIVVRRGETALFAELQRIWRDDPVTLVIYDRRRPVGHAEAAGDRRRAANADIIQTRGFYTQRLLGRE